MGNRSGALEVLVMDDRFWRGKSVLVTGHTGFKGSWLSLWLQSLDATVIGYAQPAPTRPNLFEIARVGEGMTSIMGDVLDLDHLQSVIAEYRPQIIIHMAAQSLVRHSYTQPVDTYAVNVMGTVNLLEATRRVGGKNVRAVVNVTSDKCYENREWAWGYRESEPMGGYDPYSSSKGCSELVTCAYRNSFFNPSDYARHGLGLASARAGNVIGGGDWSQDRLVPDILRAFMSGEPAIIRNPHAIRPWQHVLEPLSGYLLLAQKLWQEGIAHGEAWNFGPEDTDAQPVSRIADQLTRMWGNGASWTTSSGNHFHEAHFLKLDCTKARARLGWRPRLALAQALELTIDWYRARAEGADVAALTRRQIFEYMKSDSSRSE